MQSLQSLAHEAVTLREFQSSLSSALRHSRISRHGKIGLAISGGVDSMALAYLCSQMQPKSWPFQALVIDHNARPGSKIEAQKTCSRLDSLFGSSREYAKSQLLTLEWPNSSPEARSSGFETKARSLRYRALGLACVQQGIEALLFGHHQDDISETVLVRLARGHKRIGLAAFGNQAQIPECRGLFGIYESGGFVRPDNTDPMTGFGPEDGGLTIHRPLIPFPKSRLIATCKAAGVQWVEDESNYDVTFTGRNAVRRLLNEDVLPRALSPDSLFSLAETVRSCRNQEEIFVNTIYEATTITFDTRSGVLTAQVPRLAQIFKDGWYAWPAKARRRITARYLQLLGQSVVAHEVVRMTTLISVEAAGTIFASDFTDPEQKDKHKTTPSAPSSTSASKVVEFVREAGGVLFWHNPAATGSESEGRLWTFSRPLCDAGNGPGPVHFPPDDTNESRLPSKQDNMDTFKLWDGRFWINLYNTGPRAVSIVMLRPKQLSRLRGELPSMVKKKLNVLLKDAAPGKIRYTLPAIAIMSNLKMWSEEDMDNAQIIALPTLGIILEEWRGKITWDIRYKKLGLSGLKETIGQGGETINYKLEKIASKEGKYISS